MWSCEIAGGHTRAAGACRTTVLVSTSTTTHIAHVVTGKHGSDCVRHLSFVSNANVSTALAQATVRLLTDVGASAVSVASPTPVVP